MLSEAKRRLGLVTRLVSVIVVLAIANIQRPLLHASLPEAIVQRWPQRFEYVSEEFRWLIIAFLEIGSWPDFETYVDGE